MRPLWTRAQGFVGFPVGGLRHARFRPSLELCFPGGWIGLHCYLVIGGDFVLDEQKAKEIVEHLDRALGTRGRS